MVAVLKDPRHFRNCENLVALFSDFEASAFPEQEPAWSWTRTRTIFGKHPKRKCRQKKGTLKSGLYTLIEMELQ